MTTVVDKKLAVMEGQKIASFSEKSTLVDADNLVITDSAEKNTQKRSLFSSLKASLKTYFDGVYEPVVTPQSELTDELTAITHTAASSADYAIQDLVQNTGFGFATKDEGNTVLAVIANLQARVNGLETKLVALGFLADAD